MTNLLWQRLQSQLETKVAAFPGVAGIALLEAGEGLAINIHAKEIFPTASTIKIHVLARLLQRAEAGELDLAERVTIAASDYATMDALDRSSPYGRRIYTAEGENDET